jgi:hypothetical protein
MKKFAAIAVIILALACLYFVFHRPIHTTMKFDGRNTAFILDGKVITLTNGVSKDGQTKYFGNEATGDLTGDGRPDFAFLITNNPGGSGTFYYAVVAVTIDTGYKTTNAFFIGDRIAPQSTYIPPNSSELQVNYAERKKGEPMTAKPTQGATLLLKVTPEGVLEGLMK